jgi:hypothetical protein
MESSISTTVILYPTFASPFCLVTTGEQHVKQISITSTQRTITYHRSCGAKPDQMYEIYQVFYDTTGDSMS